MENPVIDQFGDKRWWNKKLQFHRLDGPAVEYASGSKQWWINGKRHRIDGPAIEWKNGTKLWYINDIHITKEVLNWYNELGLDTNILLTTDEQILFKLKFG